MQRMKGFLDRALNLDFRVPEGLVGWSGFTRMAIITVGGILVLQSSDDLDAPKFFYLILSGTATMVAVLRVRHLRATPGFHAMRGLLLASGALLAVVAVSLPVALLHGVAPSAWLRDATSYALFGAVAFIALDAHGQANSRWMLALALMVGALATISYVIVWMDQRSLLTVPIERLVLPSGALASMFYVVTSSYSFRAAHHRLLWAVIAGIVLGSFLIIGTRGRLPFVVLPLVLGLWSTRQVRANLPSWIVHFAAAAAVVVTVPLLQELATPSTTPPAQRPTEVLGRRIDSVDDLVTNPGGDPSMRERVSQTIGALQVFISDPIVGAGPGLEIPWTDYAGETQQGYALDSPIILLSKFGLVGLAAAALWVAAFSVLGRHVYDRIRGTPESLILVGEAAVLLYASVFQPPMQDKGTSFALMIVLALVLNRAFVSEPSVTTDSRRPAHSARNGLVQDETGRLPDVSGRLTLGPRGVTPIRS